ncbi:MAG: aldolase [Gammaproteobacteria bacterium]|nr:aldolase [Gammaproteobacteria bacterium]
MNESSAREHIASMAKSLFDRGLTFGASGNISVRLDDGWLMTPTGVSMGGIDPATLAKLDDTGAWRHGHQPTKESSLHLAMYRSRPRAGAVVHLHSTYSVAVSCIDGIDPTNVLPPLTAYYVMKIGHLPLLPYYAPGAPDLAKVVGEMASKHHAVLLANHGPVVAGTSLKDAVYATEELEETAKLFLLLRGQPLRPLTAAQTAALRAGPA